MFNFVSAIANKIDFVKKKYIYKPDFSAAITICRKFLNQKRGETPLDVIGLIIKFMIPIRQDRKSERHKNYKQPKSFTYRLS